MSVADDRHVQASPQRVTLANRLEEFKSLKDGWNSYSAPAPGPLAIENARALLEVAGHLGADPERVEPSALGGVGVTFANGPRDAVIEFYNKGTAHALLSDDSTGDMHTQPVATDTAGYQEIIRAIRKHLHGE